MYNQTQIAIKVSWVSLIVNIFLTCFKFAAGIIAHSAAMISDSIHSASDVLSTLIVMVGLSLSAKDADKHHPYGHERFECVAAVILSMLLMATAIFIGYEGFEKIVSAQIAQLPVPGILALIAAISSIITKEAMFWYTRHYARLLDSNSLMAEAWHHRSDSLSSIGALIGILGARWGFPILDPIASLIICLFIAKASLDIFKDAIDKMIDHNCADETEIAIKNRVLEHKGIHSIDLLRTREFGNRIYIELEISVNGRLPLVEAHQIANKVHDDIEMTFPKVKHIMIHVNPA